jgi:hypothetical protein
LALSVDRSKQHTENPPRMKKKERFVCCWSLTACPLPLRKPRAYRKRLSEDEEVMGDALRQ